jgi:hypothetical protein
VIVSGLNLQGSGEEGLLVGQVSLIKWEILNLNLLQSVTAISLIKLVVYYQRNSCD